MVLWLVVVVLLLPPERERVLVVLLPLPLLALVVDRGKRARTLACSK
jgi:hypothetical protein